MSSRHLPRTVQERPDHVNEAAMLLAELGDASHRCAFGVCLFRVPVSGMLIDVKTYLKADKSI